jgi:hypothetical protein
LADVAKASFGNGCNNQYSRICCQNGNCDYSLAVTLPTPSILFFLYLSAAKPMGILANNLSETIGKKCRITKEGVGLIDQFKAKVES